MLSITFTFLAAANFMVGNVLIGSAFVVAAITAASMKQVLSQDEE